MNKTLDTKERSRARRTEISKKTDKKSTALDELVKKREEKQLKRDEKEDKEEMEDGKKKWKTNCRKLSLHRHVMLRIMI